MRRWMMASVLGASSLACVVAACACAGNGADPRVPLTPVPTSQGTRTLASDGLGASPPLPAIAAPLFTPAELHERLRALVLTRNHRMGLPTAPVLVDDGDAVLYLASGGRDTVNALYLYHPANQVAEVLANAATLSGDDTALPPAERQRRERLRITTRGISAFEVTRAHPRVLVSLGGRLFLVDRTTHVSTAIDLKSGIVDPHFSPDGQQIGYVRDNNVWVYDLVSKRERAVTRGGTDEKPYGLAEFVAQEELDRPRGFWFSPDSDEMIVQYTDNSGVEKLTTSDPAAPEGAPEPRYYPRAGKANAKISFWRYNLRAAAPSAKLLELDLEHFPYVANVGWPKDGMLTFTVLNRAQTELELWGVPAGTRPLRLLRETDPTWINAESAKPHFIDHGHKFIWTSDALREPRLAVRRILPSAGPDGLASTHAALLVAGDAPLTEVAFVDVAEKNVYYTMSTDGVATVLASVPVDGLSGPQTLSPEHIVSAIVRSESRDLFLAQEPSPDAPPAWRMYRAGAPLSPVGTAPALPIAIERPTVLPHWTRYVVGKERFAAVVVRPSRTQPGEKLPIIDAIYGGPHVNTVTANGWSYLRNQWLADATGAAVVVLDVEGTPGRGREFERASYKQFGSLVLAEHVAALRELAGLNPDLDGERVGVYGWSFGGYLAARAALEYPNFFRVAVSGAPPVDWRDYDTCYTERYLGVPQGAEDAVYARESLLDLAAKPGPLAQLLLLHGTRDDNVYFSQSLKLADSLLRAGKRFEFLPLRSTTHLLYEPTLATVVGEKTAAFLRDGLLSGAVRPPAEGGR